MTESEADNFTWKNKKNVSIITSIIVGTAISAIILWITKMAFTSDSAEDLTNVFTFTIEIGIAVFISIVIFQYSMFQQSRSDNILNGLKEVQETLESERTIRKETFQKSLIKCFLSIWMKCTLIKLNLSHYGVSEDLRNKPTFLEENKVVADVIQMNKIQMSLDLQQLQTLIDLLGSDMDSKMITKLLDFQKQSMDNIMQTGVVRANLPWSAMIVGIDRIVKEYFPKSLWEFKLNELEYLLPPEYKEEIMQGRSSGKDL